MYKTRCVLAVVALCVVLAHSSAKMSIHIKELDDLKTRLTEAGEKLVVINFMTAWCSLCKKLGPKLDEMATEMADAIVLLKVDMDEGPRIADKYNINAVPTCVFVKSSKKLGKFIGTNATQLRNTINKLK